MRARFAVYAETAIRGWTPRYLRIMFKKGVNIHAIRYGQMKSGCVPHPPMRIVYLHGFASSPQSSKARYFARRFAEVGVPFIAPQLDEGNFESLTITGQLRVIQDAVAGEPAVLMGSSLGGYLAALYAARHAAEVQKLVLLAPAFQFPRRWREYLGPEDWDRWKRERSRPFFHYGSNTELRLGYQFVEDVEHYEDEPAFAQPALILHGTADTAVPVGVSRQFVLAHPNARLVEFPSGHELTDVLDGLWEQAGAFLGFV